METKMAEKTTLTTRSTNVAARRRKSHSDGVEGQAAAIRR